MLFFFKSNPNGVGIDTELNWPMYSLPEKQYKEINVDLTGGEGVKAEECHLWNHYLPQLATFVGM